MAERARGPRHLVLLGLPGAGKSTVGPLVAAALGRPFVDLDAEIERRGGRSIARIFAESGERAFRALEAALSDELLERDASPVVLSPGGGWIESEVNRARLKEVVDAVYLRVSPAIALSRMGAAVSARPLLAGVDPAALLAEISMRRGPFYLQARYAVSTDSMSPDELASSIVALVRAESGD